MKALLVLLGLLTVASCTVETQAMSYDENGQYRNSWERQQDDYYKRNFDNYTNGPLEQTRREEQRKAQEAYRNGYRNEYQADQQRRNTWQETPGQLGGQYGRQRR